MSELSECNFCTLQRMRVRARARGVDVVVEKATGEFEGWHSVRYTDADKPVAYFAALTKMCAC